MHLLGHTGALPTEDDRIARRELKAMQRDGPGRRHQNQPRPSIPAGKKGCPRSMPAKNEIRRVIEERALETPIIEQETARLDQVDGQPKARSKPQQGPGILRDVRLEQDETHSTSQSAFPDEGSSRCPRLIKI